MYIHYLFVFYTLVIFSLFLYQALDSMLDGKRCMVRAVFISLRVYDRIYIVKRVEFLYCLSLSLLLLPFSLSRSSH